MISVKFLMVKIGKKTKWFLVFLYIIFSIFLNYYFANYILKNYQNVPICPDLILNKISGNYWLSMKIAEIIIILNVILFIYIEYKDRKELFKNIFIFFTFQLIRGLLLPFTVLGKPEQYNGFLHNYYTFSEGLFPSGHIAIPFLFFLFTYKKNKLWIFFGLSTILIGFLILLGKQHYTIDIIATIFIAYSIKCFYERNLE